MPIIREPTDAEKKDFIPLHSKEDNAKTRFNKELVVQQIKAQKEGKPFAERAARDEFQDAIENSIKVSMRKNGFVEWSEVKVPKTEWNKYSDVKNFELIEEGEEHEPANGIKNTPARSIPYKKYQFKGYSNTYTVFKD